MSVHRLRKESPLQVCGRCGTEWFFVHHCPNIPSADWILDDLIPCCETTGHAVTTCQCPEHGASAPWRDLLAELVAAVTLAQQEGDVQPLVKAMDAAKDALTS